jgi:DnaD/phage-associated family protein
MTTKYWIKLYHEMLDDPKMGQLSDRLYRRTVECFLMAGDANKAGLLPSVNDMAWRLRCNPEHLESELIELSRLGILSQIDGGWIVTKFVERQATMSKAEYMRRLRDDEQKAVHYQSVTTPLPIVTDSVTNSHADKDKDKDKETDTDDAAAVFNAYAQLCGAGAVNKKIADEIGAFIDEVGAATVLDAINEAAVHNGKSWAYVRKILVTWRDKGRGAGKPSKPDVSILLSAMTKPYKQARAELEAAGAWPYVERLGKWEDIRRMNEKDIQWAWKGVTV